MPVYLDKKRGTYYFSGTFINAFGENERCKSHRLWEL